MAWCPGAMLQKFDALVEGLSDKEYNVRGCAEPVVLAESPDLETWTLDSILGVLSPPIGGGKGKRIKTFIDVLKEWKMPDYCTLEKLGEIWKHGSSPASLVQLHRNSPSDCSWKPENADSDFS